MKVKKVIIFVISGIVLIAAGYIVYSMLTTRSHSPAEQMKYNDGEFQLTFDYCRPYKKGRLIFGEESQGALVPHGVYWRTGANEATEIEFNRNLTINGNNLNAGRYRFYTVPDENEWNIAFNSDLDKWGYGEPDYDLDVLRVKMPTNQIPQSIEQFTIMAEKKGENTMEIILSWDQTQVKIPAEY